MDIAQLTSTIVFSAAWKIVVFLIISMVIADILRYTAGLIFEFLALKTDLIGIGTTIEYEGRLGIVRHIGFRRLTIEFTNADGTTVKVYMLLSEWRKMNIVYKR